MTTSRAGWQDFPLVLRILFEAFENNIYLDSLLLLLDGLCKVKAQHVYGIGRETKSFILLIKNVEASGDSFYHEIVCLGFYIS